MRVIVEALEERGRLLHHEPFAHSYPHCWRHKTPLIFRATPQWFISMERQETARACAARHQESALDARLGRAAHHRHDREPPRLVHLAPAHLGRADAAVRAQADRRAASAHAGAHREAAARVEKAASRPGSSSIRPSCSAPRPTTMRRSWTSWTSGPTPGCRSNAWARSGPRSRRRSICIWKAPTSTAAGSTARC